MTTRVNNIEAALSPMRVRRFVAISGARPGALRLYRWNAQVASAFWTPLHFLEVSVRNAVHDAMTATTGDEWWFTAQNHWVGADWMYDREIDAVQKAVYKVQTVPLTPGKVLAELAFGFWTGLLSGHYISGGTDYHDYIWVKGGVHGKFGGMKRGVLWKRLDRLRRFRNRIAHHEHLLDANLALMLQDIDSTLRQLDPGLAAWVRAMNDAPRVIAARPN